MKKLNLSVALGALAVIFVAAPLPAIAADVVPPPPEYSWTGFHIGAGGGGNFAFVKEDADASLDEKDGVESPRFFTFAEHSADLGNDAFFGTVEGGADLQLGGSFVLGLLANYDFGKTKMDNKSNADVFEDIDQGPPFFEGSGTFKTKWEIGDSWAIGGRLGFLAMDNALIYVVGGYTEADIKAESTLFTYHTSDSGWEDGWFVGGGIEALLTQNISLKAEYRYNDYGTVKNNDSFDTNPGAPFDYFRGYSDQEGDITVHSVRAVLSYRFDPF